MHNKTGINLIAELSPILMNSESKHFKNDF